MNTILAACEIAAADYDVLADKALDEGDEVAAAHAIRMARDFRVAAKKLRDKERHHCTDCESEEPVEFVGGRLLCVGCAGREAE